MKNLGLHKQKNQINNKRYIGEVMYNQIKQCHQQANFTNLDNYEYAQNTQNNTIRMNDGVNNIKDLITVRSDFKAPNTLDSSVVESQEPFETLNTMYVE